MAQMVKNLPSNLPRDLGLIPELGRSPGEGNGYPLQYSCLENPMDRVACRRLGVNDQVLTLPFDSTSLTLL